MWSHKFYLIVFILKHIERYILSHSALLPLLHNIIIIIRTSIFGCKLSQQKLNASNDRSFGKFREFFLAKESSLENCSAEGNRTFLLIQFYAISHELRPPTAETPIFFTRESFQRFSRSGSTWHVSAGTSSKQRRRQPPTTITHSPFFFSSPNPPPWYPFILIVNWFTAPTRAIRTDTLWKFCHTWIMIRVCKSSATIRILRPIRFAISSYIYEYRFLSFF